MRSWGLKSVTGSSKGQCPLWGILGMVCLLLLLSASISFAADTNILVVGSSKSFSDGGESGVVKEKAFNPAQVATQLKSILEQDSAIGGTVNVVSHDIYKSETRNVQISKSGYWDLELRCYSLAQHYMWPAGRDTRLSDLRGANGTAWNYVVIMADPYIMANFPGMYVEGVDLLVNEVRKGTAEPVLLAQWPENSSNFTAANFNEIVYRAGTSKNVRVVPAGKAWNSLTTQDSSTSHPTPHGAYLAAASIYSELFDRSAKTSAYTYNDTIADHAHSTVQANDGVAQFSGKFTGITPFTMKYVSKRLVSFRHTGTSTESYLNDALMRLDDYCGITFTRTATNDPTDWDFNYGRGNDAWEDSKDYEVNPDKYDRSYGFAMHYYGLTNAINNMPYGIDKQYYYGSSYDDGTDLGIAYNMIRPGTRETSLPADVRCIPIRLLYLKMREAFPAMNPLHDNTHMHFNLNDASAAFMYTLLSGRCPVVEEPATKDTSESSAWMRWLGHKVGYETAWRMAHLTTRAPGFKVLPSATSATSVTPDSGETMTVQFMLPPQHNVTVSVASSNPAIATVSPQTLTFTPTNYNTPQSVTVTGVAGPAGHFPFNVVFSTQSEDPAYHELGDSWEYTNITGTAPVASNASVTADENTPTPVTLTATDADGDSLTYTVLSQPTHGSLSGTAPNLTYTPNPGYFGSDSFTFKANDGSYDSNIATISITVNNTINTAPTANAGVDQTVAIVDGATPPATTGAAIFLDAGTDDGANATWEDTLNKWNLAINTGVTFVADAGSALPGITSAYDFPGGLSGAGGCDGSALQDMGVDKQPITLEVWFKPDASASYPANGQVLFETGGGTGIGIFYNNGKVETAHDSNAGQISADVSALTGEFIQAVVTYDTAGNTDNFNLYINGELKATGSRSDSDMCGGDDSGLGNRGQSNVGGAGSGDSSTESFEGQIAIFRSYHNQVLTAAEVLDNYTSIAGGASATAALDGTVNDVDGDPLSSTWTKVSGPGNVVFGDASAVDTTATFRTAGVYVLRLTADDLTAQGSDDVTITVTDDTPGNNAPVASNDTVTVDEDTSVALILNATDADGDTLSYSTVTDPANGVLTGTAPNLTYTPNADFSGSDSFTFKANGGQADSNVATVSITVNAVNDAPVASDNAVVTDEDTALAITLSATDADGDTLTYSKLTDPASGTLSGTAPNLTYTPNAGFHGTDSFTFKASDGQVDSNVATVTITVNQVVALRDPDNPQGVVAGIAWERFLGTWDLLPDFDALTASASGTATALQLGLGEPADYFGYRFTGYVEVPADGVYTFYTASDDGSKLFIGGTEVVNNDGLHGTVEKSGTIGLKAGRHALTVTFFEKTGGANLAVSFAGPGLEKQAIPGTSLYHIPAANNAPVAADQAVSTNEDTALAITLSATDADGDTLVYSKLSDPVGGTLSGTVPNLTYTPFADFYGSDSFTFNASDGQDDSNVATVTITVNAVNDAPVLGSAPWADADPATLPGTNVNVAASDIDGDALTYSWSKVSGPGTVSFSPNGNSLSDIASATFSVAGSYVLRVTVSDGSANTSGDLALEVVAPNTAPVASDSSVSTPADTAVAITLAASDADGDILTYTRLSDPVSGTLSGTAPNLTYTPNAGFTGTDSFTFQASDGTADSNVATVSITVHASLPEGVINFNEYQILAYGGSGQDVAGTATIEDGGATLHLNGNRWKAIEFPYTVTANTVLEFDFTSARQGEVHGIGFDTDLALTNTHFFQVYGTQGWGNRTYANYSGTATRHYTIPVGQHFTGTFQYLFFAMDDDAAASGDSVYSNIRIYEGTAPNNAPVANSDSITLDKDTSMAVTLSATDADGDALTYTVVTAPANGTLSGTAPGLTYTPNAGYTGSDSFTFKANDGAVDSNLATISITVQAQQTDSTVPLVSATDRIAWFALDSDASDADSNLSMSLSGAAIGTDARFGAGALQAPASGHYARIADSALLNTGGPWAARTVALWFKLDAVSGRQLVYEEGGSLRGFNIYVDNGTLYVGGWDKNKDGTDVDTWAGTWLDLGPVNAGEWTHVAMILDATLDPIHLAADTFKAFRNGVAAGSGNGMQMSAHSDDLGIGAVVGSTVYHDGATSGNGTFAGKVDDLAIWNRALTAEEVTSLAVVTPPIGLSHGVVPNVGDTWQTVTLPRTYSSMVVVATPLYTNTAAPAVARIRNASGDSFEIKLQNPGNKTAVTPASVHYIAVEEGVYTVAEHGINMEAVKMNSTVTDSKGSWIGQSQTYQNTYTSPVVFGQVMTANDAAWSVFWCRGSSQSASPSSTVLNVGKAVCEDTSKVRADETIGYIVMEAGTATVEGKTILAGTGADTVVGMDNGSRDYALTGLSSISTVALSIPGLDGGDGAWPVLYGAPVDLTLKLVVDEDRIGDSERGHTTEQISYLVVE